MYDQPLFLQTLSRFAVVLPARYDLEAVLTELTESATAVLGLWGSRVTMADDDRLRYMTAEIQAFGELEPNQEEQQAGPCRDAYETGEVVRVSDVREESARWPEFAATSTRRGVAGVAGIPMRASRRRDQLRGQRLHAASAGAAERATATCPGVTGRHRTGQGDHRIQERGHGRSGLPTHPPARPQQQRQPTDGSRGDRCRGPSRLSLAAVQPDLVFPTDHPHLVHRTRLPAPHHRRHCSPVLGGNPVGKRDEPSKTGRTGDQRLSSVARPLVTASGGMTGRASEADIGARRRIPLRNDETM